MTVSRGSRSSSGTVIGISPAFRSSRPLAGVGWRRRRRGRGRRPGKRITCLFGGKADGSRGRRRARWRRPGPRRRCRCPGAPGRDPRRAPARRPAVPWARHGARHTRAFEDTIAWLACAASKATICELMRTGWRTIGHIITRVAAEAAAGTDRLAGLRRIGIDEISYRKGHKYLVVVDHDTGLLIWAAPGRTMKTVASFFDALGPDRTAALTHVSADGASYIATVVSARAPAAIQCTDPFHVVSWAAEALNQVRREVWQAARARRPRPRKRMCRCTCRSLTAPAAQEHHGHATGLGLLLSRSCAARDTPATPQAPLTPPAGSCGREPAASACASTGPGPGTGRKGPGYHHARQRRRGHVGGGQATGAGRAHPDAARRRGGQEPKERQSRPSGAGGSWGAIRPARRGPGGR